MWRGGAEEETALEKKRETSGAGWHLPVCEGIAGKF